MIDVTLLQYMQEQLNLTSMGFKRYLYDQMDWNKRLHLLIIVISQPIHLLNWQTSL